jgi:RecG-like helicase
MTATPIPRTLALTAYGDLDVTVLRELPAGRRPIETHVASTEAERSRAYDRIREELRAGRQAFVVCPLVEESEALQARAATAEYERLRTASSPTSRRPAARPAQAAREAGGDGGVRGRRRATCSSPPR